MNIAKLHENFCCDTFDRLNQINLFSHSEICSTTTTFLDVLSAAIDAGNLKSCAEDAAYGLIDAINAGNLMDCADITVLDDAADGFIAIVIDAGNQTNCAEDAAVGLISDIDASASMNCADTSISDNAANLLIDTPINAD